MQVWRNGRRARLRGVFERVWVQVPPLAPDKNKTNLENEKLSQSKFVLFFNRDWFGMEMEC